jgi:hypothetical protein
MKFNRILFPVFAVSLVFSLSLLNSCVGRQKKSNETDQPKAISELYPLMYEMLNEITQLQPYMVSQKEFSDPKNKKEIGDRLERLSEISETVMRHKDAKAPTYRLSGEALNNHIQQLRKIYSSNNNSYARWMLAATPFACMSCHSQLPRSAKPLWNLEADSLKGSEVQKAEFLFSTHNYTPALGLFDKVVRGFVGQKDDPETLSKALSQKLTIYVRIFRNLRDAEKSLLEDLKNPALPLSARNSIKGWISQTKRLRQQRFFKNEITPQLQETLAKTQKLLSSSVRGLVSADNPNLVEYLYLSGLLYESLQKEPPSSTRIPDILFELGRLDQGLNREFFFALDQLYFKECIDKFSTHPTAKKCFVEYRAEMERLYTGTRGLDLPNEVSEDIEKARVKVGL